MKIKLFFGLDDIDNSWYNVFARMNFMFFAKGDKFK